MSKQRIEMDAVNLLEFLEKHMDDPTKFYSIAHVCSQDQMMFRLSGRDDALQLASECIRAIAKPPTQSDRTDRRIPVFAGSSGMGNTRMLEEWKRIFDMADIPDQWRNQLSIPENLLVKVSNLKILGTRSVPLRSARYATVPDNRFGVMVSYQYGFRPHTNKMTIEASFSWLLLHQCFIAGNGVTSYDWFTKKLPSNAGYLTLRLALKVIHQKCISLGIAKPDITLHVFLGVDQFYKINQVSGLKLANYELLQDLLHVLGDLMASPNPGIRIYPMFAGRKYSATIVPHPLTYCQRMPMNLLSPCEVESAVSSIPNGELMLQNALFRRYLFYFGGVPLWFTEYVLHIWRKIEERDHPSADILTDELIESAYVFARNQYVELWAKDLNPIDCVELVAYAISRRAIDLYSIKIGDKYLYRICERQLCLVNQSGEVVIPYAILRHLAGYRLISFEHQCAEAIGCFIACIDQIIDKVDEKMYDKAPWQFWEVFGAYYHALLINSLIIVGYTEIQVKRLFKGAIIKGCEEEVLLRPMLVMETEDKFSQTMDQTLGRKGHQNERHDWLNEGYVVINGERGQGVDVFFALKKKSSNGYVIFTDQRSISGSNNLGPINVAQLVQKARIKPDIFTECSTVVTCIFSGINDDNISAADLEPDSVVVSRDKYDKYYGLLASHPASRPYVKINSDPISYIQMLLQGKDNHQLAGSIVRQRQVKPFIASDGLELWVHEQSLEASLIGDYQQRVSFN
ncbi:hypothetical protein MIR68_002394 [Amoeboaphelidium protococcarum]|nr:hypothetical protein MIR68_002394 [Amoeboaphelidium protococcarum]